MRNLKSLNRLFSLLLAVILVLSIAVVPVSAVEESDTYILNRKSLEGSFYQYQSPYNVGYSFNGSELDTAPVQVYKMQRWENGTGSGEIILTYCSDITTYAYPNTYYRRLNLEDAPFSGSAAGQIRAILTHGFYLEYKANESDTAHQARVDNELAYLREKTGVEDLTIGEALSGTQAAIWQAAQGSSLEIETFALTVMSSMYASNVEYKDLCSAEINDERIQRDYTTDRFGYSPTAECRDWLDGRIKKVYDFLLGLDPIPAGDKAVSGSSFIQLNKPLMTPNADGTTYTVSVTVTVDVDMAGGDSLVLTAKLGDYTSDEVALHDGQQSQTLTIYDVPAQAVSGDVKLSISGEQTVSGYFYFDANGDRSASQAMVGYSSGTLPVYAEVTAQENRVLNIRKTTKIDGAGKPLKGIVFDIYSTEGMALPEDPTQIDIAALGKAEYTVYTDENGMATFDFTRQGLPDGTYLVVERNHPSIVAPIAPFYLDVPTYNPDNANADVNGYVYNITVKPKNEVKASVDIEKDVISVGNDTGTVDAYAPHTWIIGATIPADISTGKSYVITDTLDNRLDYLGNLKAFLETVDGTSEPVELAADTDYTLTVNDVDSLSEGNPTDSFRVELTSDGMTKIADTIGNNNYSNYILRIYFDAQINANAQMGTNIPNQAEVEYINDVVTLTDKSDVPVVYTGGINLLKVDAGNEEKYLPGAAFEVYRPATQEELGANDGNLVTIPGVTEKVVKVSFFNNADWTGTKVDSATTGEDGKLAIYGLAYGKYYLLETKAPDGYSSLTGAVEVTVDAASHTEEKAVKIGNNAGVLLPATGGVGTTVFTVSGMTLVFIACFFLYLNKRKSAET